MTTPHDHEPAAHDLPHVPPTPQEEPPFAPPAAAPVPAAAPTVAPDVPVAEDRPAPTGGDAVLDAGTYTGILEPRGKNRLPLGDGTWHQVSPKYVLVQIITNVFFLVVLAGVALFLGLVLEQAWVWIPAAALAVLQLFGLIVARRQARAIGYQLRDDDLVFRRGILWQRMVAVPYGRMQLVDITHGPLDRGFGIAQLKLVTAAATTGIAIPGLTQDAAEQLRDTLIDVAETRRTGL